MQVANTDQEVALLALTAVPNQDVMAAVQFIVDNEKAILDHPFIGYYRSSADVPDE